MFLIESWVFVREITLETLAMPISAKLISLYVFIAKFVAHPKPTSTFDHYILSHSWSANFCNQIENMNLPGCVHPNEFQKTEFSIHGLWPDQISKTFKPVTSKLHNFNYGPEFCKQNGDFNINNITDLFPDMYKMWPSESNHGQLWRHEWDRHGSCSGLNEHDYFSTALNITKQLNLKIDNQLIGKFVPTSTLKLHLQQSSNRSFELICSQKNQVQYLKEIRFCLNRNLTFRDFPKTQISEDNCHDSKDTFISSFDSK